MYFRCKTLRLSLMCLTTALFVSLASASLAEISPARAVSEIAAVPPDTPLKNAPKAEDVKSAPDTPLARVNGATITRADVTRTLKALIAQNRQGQNLPPELLKQAEATTLENLISAELLYQAGAKLEMKDLDKQVEAKVNQSRSRFPSNAEFEKALKSSDITEKDLVDFTRKDLVITNLIQKEITPAITITDEAAKKFYDNNLDKFKRPESISASHILIGVEKNATPEEKVKAQEKAGVILKKIKAGGDFAALAKSDSTCPSKDKGGELGTFGKGQMVAPFEKAAFALKPGEISDVVETEFGYHIIKVTERQEPETINFEESKEKIKDYLKGQNTQQAIIDYIAVLKGKATIEMLGK